MNKIIMFLSINLKFLYSYLHYDYMIITIPDHRYIILKPIIHSEYEILRYFSNLKLLHYRQAYMSKMKK